MDESSSPVSPVTAKRFKGCSKASIVLFFVLIYFATISELPAPIEWTGFSTTGHITQIIRNRGRIVILCDAAHWGIGASAGARRYNAVGLLPANTELIPKVAAVAPVTLDGKEIRWDQLPPGARVTVQYSIIESNAGLDVAVRRVDGWTATAPKKAPPNAR